MKREWVNGLMKSGRSQKEIIQHSLWSIIYQWDAWLALHKEARVIAGSEAYDKLKMNKSNIPVLIIEGKPKYNHCTLNSELLDHLSNGKVVKVDDCRYMLSMECPEVFNNVVLTFINQKKMRNLWI